MKLTENQKTLAIILLGALLLILPLFLRLLSGLPLVYSPEAAYTTRIIEQNQVIYDNIQERNINFNLFFHIFSKTFFLHNEVFLKIIPFLLGILSLLAMHFLLKGQESRKINLLLLLLSPIFIYVFSTFNFYCLMVFLIIMGFYVFFQKKGWWASPLFALLPVIDFLSALASLVLLLAISLHKKHKLQDFYIIMVATITTSAITISQNIIDISKYFGIGTLKTTFAEFGAIPGLTIPIIILSFVGILTFWKKSRPKLFASVAFIAIIILSISSPIVKVIFAIAITYFAALALESLIRRNWAIPILKNITIIIVICSLIFPLAAFYATVTNNPPNKEMMDALSFLKKASPAGSVVWSSEENGFFIQKYSERKTFTDSLSFLYPDYENKLKDSETIIFSRMMANTTKAINTHKIDYFYIDPNMKEIYWNNKNEGLMFLLKNSETFINIYSVNEIEIYARNEALGK